MPLLDDIKSRLNQLLTSIKRTKKYDEKSQKIFVIGDSGVGKSAYIKRLTEQTKKGDQDFPKAYHPTPMVDASAHQFQREKKSGLRIFSQTVTTVFWEIPGHTEKIVDSLTKQLADTSVVMIFISPSSDDNQNQENIENWHRFISDDNSNKNVPIILVENYDNAKGQFRPETIEALQQKNISHIAISINAKSNFDKLEELVWAAFEQKVPQIKQDKDDWQLSVTFNERWSRQQRVMYRIDQLEDNVAKFILKSVDRVLSTGTNMNSKNAYNLSIFGGGIITTKCLGIKQKVPTHVNYMQEIIHYQVQQEPESLAHAKLKLVFQKSEETAKADHFSRKANTQIFYDKTIPIFIDKVLEPDNIKLFYDIDKLETAAAKYLLVQLKAQLLSGTNKNKKLPYKLGVFGGVIYQEGDLKIKVPHHVSLMLSKLKNIDEILDYKLILQELFHDILAASSSHNSRRKDSTQNFYQTVLPTLIKDKFNPDNFVANIDRQNLSIVVT